MKLVRLASIVTFVTLGAHLGCGSGEADVAQVGEGAAPLNAGYGYEFLPDRVTSGAAHAAEVTAAPRVGRLSPEAIQRVVRAGFGEIAACARGGREGEITVRFMIREDGSVDDARLERSTVEDAASAACVVDALSALRFPSSTGGLAVVLYPLQLGR